MYSGIEAGEEIVEPFSQSFSPLWALIRLGDINREGECERLEGVQKKCLVKKVVIYMLHVLLSLITLITATTRPVGIQLYINTHIIEYIDHYSDIIQGKQ